MLGRHLFEAWSSVQYVIGLSSGYAEYVGYLMSTKSQSGMERSEYVCVHQKPDVTNNTKKWNKGGLLHFIEATCDILPYV